MFSLFFSCSAFFLVIFLFSTWFGFSFLTLTLLSSTYTIDPINWSLHGLYGPSPCNRCQNLLMNGLYLILFFHFYFSSHFPGRAALRVELHTLPRTIDLWVIKNVCSWTWSSFMFYSCRLIHICRGLRDQTASDVCY